MPDGPALFWTVADLRDAYRRREVSPVEVTRAALERIEALNPQLHAFVAVTAELAMGQAADAEARYAEDGGDAPLLGVPISIKDLFDVEGVSTSLGSLVYGTDVARQDSVVVGRLRSAGAVLLGKTNTPEFGQSATTENLLGPPASNPWALDRTPGGSSGGAAASVAAGLASLALGSDGGGSIRIPAALCGIFGIKPSIGCVPDQGSFQGMTDFVCPGPLARRVADARPFMQALTGEEYALGATRPLRIGWCPAPEGRPVDAAVASSTKAAVELAAAQGHDVEEINLPISGWRDAFAPLVLADEWRFRQHLLDGDSSRLTVYARRTIEAGAEVTDGEVEEARRLLGGFRERVEKLFDQHDLILTPATATVAFPIGDRPDEIDGTPVDRLWGPFPFTAPFNVSGSAAASLPCGLVDGLPVGLQVIGRQGAERTVLDFCEQLEAEISFPANAVVDGWSAEAATRSTASAAGTGRRPGVVIADDGSDDVLLVCLSNPRKRNALTLAMLDELAATLHEAEAAGSVAVVLAGQGNVFSSGFDLNELGRGVQDLVVDEKLATVQAAIASLGVPVIAAIEGPCIGAGLDIALACDARVAGSSASLGLPAARLGLLYRPEAVKSMVLNLGAEATTRLLVLGERFSADEALVAGLVGRVVSDGAALETATALGAGARTPAPAATKATKALIAEIASGSVDLDAWEGRRRQLLEAPERREAVNSALEKRRESSVGKKVTSLS